MAILCTSVEQSRRLVELGLDTNTADMYWIRHWGKEIPRSIQEGYEGKILSKAWSLAALLDVLPEYNLQRTDWYYKIEHKIVVTINGNNYASKNYNNPVDACYELILKLNELKML